MTSLLQTLLSSLLDSPLLEKTAGKALSIVKAHFTLSAEQINSACQEGYGYALSAICIGLSAPFSKIFNAKITREFADKIEQHYLQPFAKQQGLSDEELSTFRKQWAKSLKKLAKSLTCKP